MKSKWVLLLALIGAVILAPNVWAKVTLDKGGSGQAEWWGDDPLEEHPCSCNGGAVSVELAAYFSGDWAAVLLDTCSRFKVEQIEELCFVYRCLEPQPAEETEGPRMVLLLKKEVAGGYISYYLVVSAPAAVQTTDCVQYCPTDWYYGPWDGEDFSSYEEEDGANTLADLQAELGDYDVVAVGVLMGVVGLQMGGSEALPGKAIVDCVTITWTENGNGVTHGGTYDLEKPWPEVETFEDEGRWAGWTKTGLWRLVDSSELYGEPAVVRQFPSPTHAAYFGTPNPSTGKGSYDTTGSIARGCLTSPANILNPGDKYISISFDYFRVVEQYIGKYPDQVYDKTYVQIKFDGNAWSSDPAWANNPWGLDNKAPGGVADPGWKTIWYKDSSHPNSTQWETVTISNYPDANGKPDPKLPIVVPADATKVWIRFCFDSVDGYNNDYLGWLIDNVVKTHTCEPECLHILTESLPQGTVKEEYNVTLQANKAGVRWELVVDPRQGYDPLPPRLELEKGTGRIYGHPEVGTQGTYRIKIRAIWGDGRGCNTAEKEFYLTIRSPATGVNVVAYENFTQPVGWTLDENPTKPFGATQYGCPNLWHQTDYVVFNGTDIVTDDYGYSAYFGKDDSTNPNYACKRAKGCLVSPWYPIDPKFAGEEIVIGFKSWRQVEYYPKGEFDKTEVWVQLEGRDWKLVWSKDSRDPSETSWTWEEVHTGITVPSTLPKVRIKFCFDSVDSYNNNYVGWLIDEVTIYAGSAMLSIVNECPLPEGSVGQVYKVELKSSGGKEGNREWSVEGNLPPGLGLVRDNDRWWIQGVPREAGTWCFTLKVVVKDNDGKIIDAASKDCCITITEQVVLLYEDFEGDPKWSMSGLWHIRDLTTDKPTLVPEAGHGKVAYYANQNGPNKNTYITGDRTTGALTLQSPVINVAGVPAIKVMFDYWREVENFAQGEYDITLVQVKFDTGTWTTIWKKSSANPSEKAWTKAETPAFLVPAGATQMLIRFVFDSVDKWYNGFTGWLVDNIKVEKAPAAGAQPLSALALTESLRPRDMASMISVINIPNPVRDVHTTTFLVRGVEAERVRVEVYDLTGRLVWRGEAEGNEVVWHTEDLTGLPLANGVYLYKVYVKVGGEWVVTNIQKLVILR